MRELSPPTPKSRKLKGVADINKGGTGAADTGTAAINLDAVSFDLLGNPGKAAKIQPNQGIDPANYPTAFPVGPTVEGPTDIYTSTTSTFTISNYDRNSDAVYTVSVDVGTVSRVRDIITYTSASVPGTVNMTVAKRKVKFIVKPAGVVKPSLVSPLSGSSGMPSSVPLTSSAFKVTTGMSNHLSSDWEISTKSDFSEVVKSTFNDTFNKTSFLANNLKEATTYYVRVRYRDLVLGNSEWSEGSSFTTKETFNLNTEERKLTSPVPKSPEYFGWSVCFSGDGSRLAVGDLRDGPNRGAVFVYLRVGNNWTQEAKLFPAEAIADDFGGYDVSMTPDGTRFSVGYVLHDSNSIGDRGAVFIFSRTGNTWAQEARLLASDATTGDRLGWSTSISDDGSRVFSGAYVYPNLTYVGAVYVFVRNGTTWTQEAKLQASDKANGDQFGISVDCDSTGSRVVVGAYLKDVNGLSDAGGGYIFTRTGTTWTQEMILTSPVPFTNEQFGTYVRLSKNGLIASVGAPNADARGAVYLYRYASGVWSYWTKLSASNGQEGDLFGTSFDVNSDSSIVVVGAYNKTVDGKATTGSVFVYKLKDGSWIQASIVTSSDNAAGEMFGWSMAVSPDGSRMAAGTRNKTVNGLVNAGAVYIFN